VEVTTDVNGLSLARVEFFQDLGLSSFEGLSHGLEGSISSGESLSPEEGQEVVSGTVVGLVDSSLGSLVFV